MAAAASAGPGCDQGDLPAGRASGDDGADLDRGRDLGRGSRRVRSVGIRPGERGSGAEGRQGSGQAAQDCGDTTGCNRCGSLRSPAVQVPASPPERWGERVGVLGSPGTWPGLPWMSPFVGAVLGSLVVSFRAVRARGVARRWAFRSGSRQGLVPDRARRR